MNLPQFPSSPSESASTAPQDAFFHQDTALPNLRHRLLQRISPLKPSPNTFRGLALAVVLFPVLGGTNCSVHKRMNEEFFKYQHAPDASSARTRPGYEALAIKVETRTLQGWFVPSAASGPEKSAVLIFHGVGETNSDWFPVMDYLSAHGVAAMVFDYSAFGKSTGDREYKNLSKDGEAALELFRKKTAPKTRRFVLGYSLGAGIALESIGESGEPLTGVVVISGWRSWKGWLIDTERVPRALGWLLPDIFDSEANLRKTTMPVLIVHGSADKLMPVDGANQLGRAAGERAQLRIVQGQGHNIPLKGKLDVFWKPLLRFMTGDVRSSHFSSIRTDSGGHNPLERRLPPFRRAATKP
ncbi:MAG: alpha/beta fold hydrolase [Verrucomicrobiota bacterium]